MAHQSTIFCIIIAASVSFLGGGVAVESAKKNWPCASAPSNPHWTDTIVWRNAAFAGLLLNTLCRSEFNGHRDINFGKFGYVGSDTIRSEGSGRPLRPDWFPFQAKPDWRPDTLWVSSPDSTKAVRAGNFGEPDGDLLLFNRKGLRLIERLESCGTPCRYLGAAWSSNRYFTFLQIEEHFDNDDYSVPPAVLATAKLYDLLTDSVHTFQTKPIRP